MVTILNRWRTNSAGILVPIGLIMPLNDLVANMPVGWTQYDGEDRSVRCHPSLAGTNNGNLTWGRTSTANGSHTGASTTVGGSYLQPNEGYNYADNGAKGNHSHSFTVTYHPPRRYQVLMKATAEAKKFPINTGILADFAIKDASDITPIGGEMLYGAAIGGSSDNTNLGQYGTFTGFNNAGSHTHQSGTKGRAVNSGKGNLYTAYGAHTNHSAASVSAIDAQYRFYLGMWASASKELSVEEGSFGMWESAIPPKGWAICDGTLGTPDLNEYHIGLDSGVKMGTLDGDGTLGISGSMSTGGSHKHNYNYGFRASRISIKHSNWISHSHTLGLLTTAWSQQYKTLIFIKAIG